MDKNEFEELMKVRAKNVDWSFKKQTLRKHRVGYLILSFASGALTVFVIDFIVMLLT